MSTTLRTTLRGTACTVALAGLVGLTLGWTPVAPDAESGVQEAEVYKGALGALGDSGVEGTVQVKRMGEQLSVQLSARELASGTHPQHVHAGASCDEFGAVAVPLDSDLGSLSVEDYPSTEGESATLTYNGKGSNAEYADLDLADMTVVVHASDGTPVACAALDRKGGGEEG